MAYTIRPLATQDAPAAARLHAEGQPGTFLTNLGPAFLTAFYAEMAANPHSYGFVAEDCGEVIAAGTGTLDTGALFRDLILRRGFRLILPVATAILRHPSLIPMLFETVLYPLRAGRAPEGEHAEPDEPEMLDLNVKTGRRHEGMGKAIWWRMVEENRKRGFKSVGLTVEESNHYAVRFHELQGARLKHVFMMYGRRMCYYVLPLTDEEARPPSADSARQSGS